MPCLGLPQPQVYSQLLIYQQPMARITAASEACDLVHYAIYTSRGEAAALRIGLPLPLVHSQLKASDTRVGLKEAFAKSVILVVDRHVGFYKHFFRRFTILKLGGILLLWIYSSMSVEEKVLLLSLLYYRWKRRKTRKMWIHPIIQGGDDRGYFNNLFYELIIHQEQFFNFTRMSTSTFVEF